MERLLIILAVLVCLGVGVAMVAMSARGRRPPLRMDDELDVDDEHLVLCSVGPLGSPIDRAAQVLDAQVLDLEVLDLEVEPHRQVEPPRPVEAPGDGGGEAGAPPADAPRREAGAASGPAVEDGTR